MYTQHPHIGQKTQNCDILSDLLKKEKLKYHMVAKFSDPLLWHSYIYSGAVHFLLIILEMVLHLHLSPAVFDYTDWTWLGKPHTCLYKTLQLTVHVRANENHEVKGTAWRAQRQNCGKAQIWPRLQKNSAALKVPKSTVASIILKWKTLGRPEPFLELAVRPNWAIGGEEPWWER